MIDYDCLMVLDSKLLPFPVSNGCLRDPSVKLRLVAVASWPRSLRLGKVEPSTGHTNGEGMKLYDGIMYVYIIYIYV